MPKKIRQYYCVYCNKTFENNDWSKEHVIPKDIGGPNCFSITCCKDCNNKIGTQIENIALQSQDIRCLFAEIVLQGHRIKTRRNKEYIKSHRDIGFSYGMPVEFGYDLKDKSRTINYKGVFPGFSLPKDFSEIKSAIIPVENVSDKEKLSLMSLTNKIILGTCMWLWGKDRLSEKTFDSIRRRLWNPNLDHLEELDSNAKHASIVDDKKPPEKQIEKDALDNKPNHTIGIFYEQGALYGIINLFGTLESSSLIDFVDRPPMNENGIVVISYISENKVHKMNLKEYLHYKELELPL